MKIRPRLRITTLLCILNGHRHNICIRQELGYCCVKYSKCADTNSWAFDTTAATSLTDTDCTNDFIEISGLLGECQGPPPATLFRDRLCGQYFSIGRASDADANYVCGNFFQIFVCYPLILGWLNFGKNTQIEGNPKLTEG